LRLQSAGDCGLGVSPGRTEQKKKVLRNPKLDAFKEGEEVQKSKGGVGGGGGGRWLDSRPYKKRGRPGGEGAKLADHTIRARKAKKTKERKGVLGGIPIKEMRSQKKNGFGSLGQGNRETSGEVENAAAS